jgi:hypothetical protein
MGDHEVRSPASFFAVGGLFVLSACAFVVSGLLGITPMYGVAVLFLCVSALFFFKGFQARRKPDGEGE